MTAPEPADLARKERECCDSNDEWLLIIPEPPMKPHDQWNSTDIAQFGRMSMHVDVYDAEPPKPRARYVDPLWLLGLGIVGIAALYAAVLIVAGRVW